jgi:GT2 family glycosyltransferase
MVEDLKVPCTSIYDENFPEVTFLVLNFNGGKNLLEAVSSIYAQKVDFPFDVVLVDNGSDDGSEVEAIKQFPKMHAVLLGRNCGTNAYNKAMYLVRGKYIFFTSDDKILQENCLAECYKTITEISGVGQVTPMLVKPSGEIDVSNTWISFWFYAGKASEKPVEEVYKIPFIGMGLISREAIQKAGGYLYDGRYFFYFEDVDLGIRLKKAGYVVVMNTRAKATHLGDIASQKLPREQLIFLAERNRMLTFYKHFNSPLTYCIVGLAYAAKVLYSDFTLDFKKSQARIDGFKAAKVLEREGGKVSNPT